VSLSESQLAMVCALVKSELENIARDDRRGAGVSLVYIAQVAALGATAERDIAAIQNQKKLEPKP
jgi:hypothetical protein